MFHQSLSVLAIVVCAGCQYADTGLHTGYEYNGYVIPLQRNETHVSQQPRKITLDVYYESLCPDSIREYRGPLVAIMNDPTLAPYIDLRTYPYGKATTYMRNGVLSFQCQHGERECYGNKLHACAIEELPSTPFWLNFNACLMSAHSNDYAADKCAAMMRISSEPIKACAKSARGSQLLKYYGDESRKVSYHYIPHIVINGVPLDSQTDLATAVRAAINNLSNLYRYSNF